MTTVDVWECDLSLADGSVLHAYDTVQGHVPVLWHHGTPNLGHPPEPLFALGHELGVRWISWDRPGYGTSTPRPGRDVASAGQLAREVLDRLGVESAVALGHSGGGPHALAGAAMLPDRVGAAALVAGLAPLARAGADLAADCDGFDPFADMAPSGVAALGSAAAGRAARARWEDEAGDTYDPEFTPGDLAVLDGAWAWFGSVVGPAVAAGPDAAIDDDVAYASPWGFDPGTTRGPVLLVHGDADRVVPAAHARHLATLLPHPELRVVPGAGHLSVLTSAPDALRWLVAHAS